MPIVSRPFRMVVIVVAACSPSSDTSAGDRAASPHDPPRTVTSQAPRPAAPAANPRNDAWTLPHRSTIAPGVHSAGFSERFGSANCGWVELQGETMLIDLPRGIPASDFFSLVAASTGKPSRTLMLTQAREGDGAIIRTLVEKGITRIVVSPGIRSSLQTDPGVVDPGLFQVRRDRGSVEGADDVEFLPLDDLASRGGSAVFLPARAVLFAGPMIVHGRRASLAASDTERWIAALKRLESLGATHVVPGAGSWGGPELVVRQRRFLSELRRQVGHHIAQGRTLTGLDEQVRIPAADLVAMPYDHPTGEDIEHVYRELTVPVAPFGRHRPSASDVPPHALVLIGDQPHEPGHIEEGLRPAFETAGVVPHFAVDVRCLSAENLARVRLLVILRDGLQRPSSDGKDNFVWMTREQEEALARFVEAGGGLLSLHNSLGLYPSEGPYLDLMAGRYTTHGPLERFRVEVADPAHPVTRDVRAYFAADEQHTPTCEEGRVHILLRNHSDDGKSAPAGWVREHGRGRICYLASGHTREALLHPMFQKLLRNSIRWCSRIADGELPDHPRP
jgi:type 1 glutamine amidotransferase